MYRAARLKFGEAACIVTVCMNTKPEWNHIDHFDIDVHDFVCWNKTHMKFQPKTFDIIACSPDCRYWSQAGELASGWQSRRMVDGVRMIAATFGVIDYMLKPSGSWSLENPVNTHVRSGVSTLREHLLHKLRRCRGPQTVCYCAYGLSENRSHYPMKPTWVFMSNGARLIKPRVCLQGSCPAKIPGTKAHWEVCGDLVHEGQHRVGAANMTDIPQELCLDILQSLADAAIPYIY